MEFKFAYGTDIGMKRKQNQDSVAAEPELGLFIVADGMGGHRGGETASALATETAVEVTKKTLHHCSPRQAMTEAIRGANRAIYTASLKNQNLQGMGTTTTALLFSDQTLTVGHVGDSRCYFFRTGCMWQVTRDHSLVQEKLKAGLITREQMKTDQMKNVITRSVGFESDVNVEIYELTVQVGDVFLVCSDGLSSQVDDDKIQAVIQRTLFTEQDLQKTIEELIVLANESGGDDNITTILVEVVGKD